MKRIAMSVATMTAVLAVVVAPSFAEEQQQVHALDEVVVTATKTEREVKAHRHHGFAPPCAWFGA